MPLDAISLRAVVEELRPQLLNLRIDKVQQPARDQVILLLRGNKRLLLNAGANAPRLQLTELLRDTFDMTPAGIIRALDLRKPIYADTAARGHFGVQGKTWEQTDKAALLRSKAGL